MVLPRLGSLIWIWFAAGLALVACSPPAGSATVVGDGWKVTLEWSPGRPKALQPAHLVLRVGDRADRPLEVEALQAEADMPEMSHKPDELRFRKIGQGTYEAVHTFSMDGRWRVRVTGIVTGSGLEASFELNVGGP